MSTRSEGTDNRLQNVLTFQIPLIEYLDKHIKLKTIIALTINYQLIAIILKQLLIVSILPGKPIKN